MHFTQTHTPTHTFTHTRKHASGFIGLYKTCSLMIKHLYTHLQKLTVRYRSSQSKPTCCIHIT